MKDLLLNDGHDLYTDGKDFTVVSGSPVVAQRVRIRLLTVFAEWKWNYLIGVDWFDKIFSTVTSYTQKSAILRNVVSQTAGVATIETFSFGVDTKNRTARLVFVATTIYDDTVRGYVSQVSKED